MSIIDISPTISEETAVFPGDQPFLRRVSLDLKKGDNLTLSSMQTTLHIGAHADGPNHYDKDNKDSGIDSCDLRIYMGPCQVVEVNLSPGARIALTDVDMDEISQPRVLFKTKSFPNPNQWCDDFNSLSPEVVEALFQKGVILVGIDTPSIDPAEDKELMSHRAVARRKMAILEGLVLDDVIPSEYGLIALPLKIKGADASPVRAILTPLGV